MKKEYSQESWQRSSLIRELGLLTAENEYQTLVGLISSAGERIGAVPEGEVLSVLASDFDQVDQRVGFAMLANSFFEIDMNLNGVSLLDENARVNFVIKDGVPVAFFGEKFEHCLGNSVYYVDIVGVSPSVRGTGVGGSLGRVCLDSYLRSTNEDVVILTRTQNPMMAGVVRKSLPTGVPLFPFDSTPDVRWKNVVNFLVADGFISRNNRVDSFFDPDNSLIHWGAYGKFGDGSTWENMIKKYEDELVWGKGIGLEMVQYLEKNGTSLTDCLQRGHAFILGAYLERNKLM